MLKVIKGSKGSGKTKKLIDLTNELAASATGSVVYITDTLTHSKEIATNVRFINILDYSRNNSVDSVLGFVRGVVSADSDIQNVFFDGLLRVAKEDVENLEEMFLYLDELSNDAGCDIYMTVSSDSLPLNMKKYVKRK